MIYLGGSCAKDNRKMMEDIASKLRGLGEEVYCPFELKIDNAWDYSQEDWSKMVFDSDVEALDNCDILLMISPGRHSTAGTNWEQGYAYAKGKTVVAIQVTNEPTSLMTYNGSNVFVNSSKEHLFADIVRALRRARKKKENDYCTTVLT